jgi:fucose permease
MAGRLLLGRVLLLASAAALLPFMAGTATVTLALLTVSSGLPAAAALFVVSAFCLSGILPTTLALAGSALPERTGTLFRLIFSLSVIGGMLVPWLGGHLAAALGLRAIPILAAGVYVAVTLLALLARRLNRTSGGT